MGSDASVIDEERHHDDDIMDSAAGIADDVADPLLVDVVALTNASDEVDIGDRYQEDLLLLVILERMDIPEVIQLTACSLGLSATSQQYFSLRTNQPPASSTFLSEQISTSHQPPAKRTGPDAADGLVIIGL
jgi:hypothetical protein